MKFHPGNVNRSTRELLGAAIKETIAMNMRQNKHETVMRRTIPAQWYDSDILLVDALQAALCDMDGIERDSM